MKLDLEMTGVAEAAKAMGVEVDMLRGRFEAAVFTTAGLIATDAMKLAPFKSGVLRESRFVTRTMPVEIGFNAPYAALTHEVGAHKKYLQRALAERTPRVAADIARTMRAQEHAKSRQTIATAPSKHPDRPHNQWSGASTDKKERRRLRPQAERQRRPRADG